MSSDKLILGDEASGKAADMRLVDGTSSGGQTDGSSMNRGVGTPIEADVGDIHRLPTRWN